MKSIHFADLGQWWEAFQKHPFFRNLVFSETWNTEWKAYWAEYDRLDAERVESGAKKLDWQNNHEKQRRKMEETRLRLLTKWEEVDWDMCPLGYRMQFYLFGKEQERVSDWATALHLWESCLEILNDPIQSRGLLEKMSTAQQTSYRLLKDWWNASYQPEKMTIAAKNAIREASSKPDDNTVLAMGKSAEIDKVKSKIQESIYHSWMFLLFCSEFLPSKYNPYMTRSYHGTITTIRRDAFAYAVAQMIAHSFAVNCLSTPAPTSKAMLEYPAYSWGPQEWLPASNKIDDMPYYLWDIKEKKTIITAELHQLDSPLEYTCISHTWGRWRQNMERVDGVPWYVPGNELFDVHQLANQFQSGLVPTPYIWFDLFCIPQDDRPKPSKVFGLFSRRKKQDPKYRLTTFLELKQREEIKRQAGIFRGAVSSIILFNDIESWDGVGAALDWFSANWLRNTNWPGVYETTDWVNMAEKAADVPVEFLKPAEGDELDKIPNYGGSLGTLKEIAEKKKNGIEPTYSKLSSWFSSLWTLQEAALCPDLILASRHWKLLRDGHGQPIPLNALVLFVSYHEKYGRYRIEPGTDLSDAWNFGHLYLNDPKIEVDKYHEKWPRGGVDLFKSMQLTKLDILYRRPTREGLLTLANIRTYSDSRAPGIMSAMGITDWYETGNSSTGANKSQDRKDLVCGMYPLKFVQEAALKIGASFYFANLTVETKSSVLPLERIEKEIGSMLPFSAPKGWTTSRAGFPEKHGLRQVDHPSVAGWIINLDGSVSIRSAGILASTHERHRDGIVVTISIPQWYDNKVCNINEWMDGVSSKYDVWAISMFTDAVHHGLILSGLKSPTSKGKLWKIGRFWVIDIPDMPKTTEVNWTVV